MSNIEVQPQHRQHEALDEQIRARENEELLGKCESFGSAEEKLMRSLT